MEKERRGKVGKGQNQETTHVTWTPKVMALSYGSFSFSNLSPRGRTIFFLKKKGLALKLPMLKVIQSSRS